MIYIWRIIQLLYDKFIPCGFRNIYNINNIISNLTIKTTKSSVLALNIELYFYWKKLKKNGSSLSFIIGDHKIKWILY